MNAPLFASTWQWRRLALCQGLALGLLLLWLIPGVRSQLLAFDAGLFHALNAPLAQSNAWLYLWTFFSLRPVDALVGLVLLALLVRGGWAYPARQVRPALAAFVGLLVILLIVRTLLTKGIEAAGLQHASPSDVLSGAYLLSDRFPGLEHGWELKDRSGASFPATMPRCCCSGHCSWHISPAADGAWWWPRWRCCSCCRGWWPAPTGVRMTISAVWRWPWPSSAWVCIRRWRPSSPVRVSAC